MKLQARSILERSFNFILYGVVFSLVSFVYHWVNGDAYDHTIPYASADTIIDPWIYYSDGGGSCDGNADPGGSPGCSDAL